MENVQKSRGTLKSQKPDAGGAASKPFPIVGIVKNNIDPLRMGRLQVYLDYGGGSNPDDATQWRTVRWCFPFYGVTRPQAPPDDWGSYVANPTSYGMWFSPPDIGTQVICIFVQGKDDYGYAIGAIPDPETLHMIPAIGSSDNIIVNEGEASKYGGATKLPVTNLNAQNTGLSDALNFLNEAKPVHSYSAMAMMQQGIIRDPVRGPLGTSANRESPSRVGWGVSTPGRPIFEGGYDDAAIASAASGGTPPENLRIIARRGGHSIILDDGDNIGRDCVARIRTALGHQILMSDDGQVISILHSNGQCYIELGKEGTVDVFATNSINLRTQGDLNFHADRNVNIHANKDVNIHSKNLNIHSEKNFNHRVGSDSAIATGGTHTHLVSGPCSFESGGDISLASVAIAYVNGSKVNLNTGKTATTPQEVDPIPLLAQTDTLWDQTVGWAAVPGYTLSIASRVPAHYPWANAGQGVDAKVDSDAASNLPAAPTPAAAGVNAAAGLNPSTPTSVAAGAAMPVAGAVSNSIDQNTTSNMLGAVATNVANGPAAAAVTTGSAVVEGSAYVGQFAQTPEQMETGGYLKPGSSKLINSLTASGSNVEMALTNNLFTGKDGINSLQQFVDNIDTQAASMVKNFQQAQNYFTAAGVITGKEHPTQIAGIVQAGTTQGLENTFNALSNGIQNAGAVLDEIASGNFAATLAENVTGGLASISTALNLVQPIPSLESLSATAKGIAASAFAQIKAGFPPLEVGVPQNLKEIAKKIREDIQGIDVGDALVGAATSSLSSAIASGVNNLVGGRNTVNNIVNQTENALNNLSNDVNNLLGTNIDLSGNQLDNLNNLADSLDNAVGSLNNTLNDIGDTLKNAASDLLNGELPDVSLDDLSNTLSNGISSGLSQLGLSGSAAAELMSSISALGSGGAVSIKLPSVGADTFNRAGLTAAISDALGDSRIPMPNFAGEIAGAAVSAAEDLISALKEKIAGNQEKSDKVRSLSDLEKAFYEAEKNYPPGDPRIVAAYQAYAEAAMQAAIDDQTSDL